MGKLYFVQGAKPTKREENLKKTDNTTTEGETRT